MSTSRYLSVGGDTYGIQTVAQTDCASRLPFGGSVDER